MKVGSGEHSIREYAESFLGAEEYLARMQASLISQPSEDDLSLCVVTQMFSSLCQFALCGIVFPSLDLAASLTRTLA